MLLYIWGLLIIPIIVAWSLGLVVSAVVFTVIVIFLRHYIQPSTPEDKKNFVQLIFQVLGGIIVILGVYFTWQEFKTSRETLQNSQETLRTTQQGQITERFTRAIDQLGKSDDQPGKYNNLAIRLGGIYSLERIARDSVEADQTSVEADQTKENTEGRNDHWAIMEILTTYIRQNAGWTVDKEKEIETPKLSPDIQAILTVLGRRYLKYNEGESQRLNLSRTDMRVANLNNANLNGADLMGTHLDEAQLKDTYLNEAILYGVSLKGAFLNGARLQNANLQGAIMRNAELPGAELTGADLRGADLRCAIVSDQQLNSALTNAQTLRPAPQMKCPMP